MIEQGGDLLDLEPIGHVTLDRQYTSWALCSRLAGI